jgi:hypothetical protein
MLDKSCQTRKDRSRQCGRRKGYRPGGTRSMVSHPARGKDGASAHPVFSSPLPHSQAHAKCPRILPYDYLRLLCNEPVVTCCTLFYECLLRCQLGCLFAVADFITTISHMLMLALSTGSPSAMGCFGSSHAGHTSVLGAKMHVIADLDIVNKKLLWGKESQRLRVGRSRLHRLHWLRLFHEPVVIMWTSLSEQTQAF